jgi:tRNA pseudouridine38-40 synthase
MDEPDKHRIRLTLHYDGTGFIGWQLQPAGRTVQGEIEQVLERLFLAPTRVIGSGRTDRGVHATGQVASVDVPPGWTAMELRRALNALLPRDIWVASAETARADFHARFDAIRRSYRYRVGIAEACGSPFHSPWCWPIDTPLDLEPMQLAAAALPGEHSFRAFAKAGQEHRGDMCRVATAEWREWNELGFEFNITANRFLHHTVRYLVGTLVDIGRGRRPVDDLAAMLTPDTAMVTSPPAPARGLFLSRVEYAADPAPAEPSSA